MAKTVEPRRPVSDPVFIDADKLDLEVLDHANRVYGCRSELARLEREVGRAEAALKLTTAGFTVKIRLDPAKYGLPDKPAMDLVSSAVIVQPEYIEAYERLINAKYARDVVDAEKHALWDRRSMLDNAVKLLLSDNLQSRVSGESREAVDDAVRRRTRGGLDL